MSWRISSRLWAGIVALLVWALAAGSVAFWLLKANGMDAADVTTASGPGLKDMSVDGRSVARVLGATHRPQAAPPAPDVSTRLKLRGILSQGGKGAALISVDGKPAKPLRVGAAVEGVEGGWTVHALSPQAVVLAAGGQQTRLEMPPMSQRSSVGDAVAPPPPAAPAPGAGSTLRQATP